MSLALLGGTPVRTRPFGLWPVFTEAELNELHQVLKSGHWGGVHTDSHTARFEAEFAASHEARYAVTMCNGTCALMAALRALDVGLGDEVIVPAVSFIGTATAVSLLGAVPVFVDISRQTHCLDVGCVERAVSDRTKAVIAVHLGGYPCDVDSLSSIARRHGFKIIEDCAQAHGAERTGRKVGTSGDAGVFSFAETKNVTAGEGGAVITNDAELARRLAELRNHGRVSCLDQHFTVLGWNFRLTGLQAAILRVQLQRLELHLKIKHRAFDYLASGFRKATPWLSVLEWEPSVSRHALYTMSLLYSSDLLNGIPKQLFLEALRAEGIPASGERVVPLYTHSLYQSAPSQSGCPSRIQTCPNAEQVCGSIVLLGQHLNSGLLLSSPEELDDVIEAIVKIGTEANSLASYRAHFLAQKKSG